MPGCYQGTLGGDAGTQPLLGARARRLELGSADVESVPGDLRGRCTGQVLRAQALTCVWQTGARTCGRH